MSKNKIKKQSISFLIIFLIITTGIIFFHYMRNFKVRSSVPSDAYSKEVKLEFGNINGNPALISFNDGYIVSYSIGDKVFINQINKQGKEIKKVSIKADSTTVSGISLVSGNDSYYLVFSTYTEGKGKVTEYNFDNNLNKLGEKSISNFRRITKIDENSLIYFNDNKGVYKNFSENYSIDLNYKGISMVSGIKQDNGYYVLLLTQDGETKGIHIGKDKTIQLYNYHINKMSNMDFESIATSSDEKNIYSLIEVDIKGESKGVNLLTFSKDKGSITYNQFSIGDNKLFYNVISVSSGDKAKFAGITEIAIPGGEYSNQVAEFSIKDGVGEGIVRASRLDKIPYGEAYSGDSIVFMTNEGNENESVYITSKNEDFRKANNGVRSDEKLLAASETLTGSLTSIAFTFVLGISWIFFGAAIVGIIMLIVWLIKSAKDNVLIPIGYLITAVFKTYMIYSTIYIRFKGSVTGLLSNTAYGLSASMAISMVCLIYLIYKQKTDDDGTAFFIFFIPLMIDTILTQLLFVPFL